MEPGYLGSAAPFRETRMDSGLLSQNPMNAAKSVLRSEWLRIAICLMRRTGKSY
jgi:hypothetical protein